MMKSKDKIKNNDIASHGACIGCGKDVTSMLVRTEWRWYWICAECYDKGVRPLPVAEQHG